MIYYMVKTVKMYAKTYLFSSQFPIQPAQASTRFVCFAGV